MSTPIVLLHGLGCSPHFWDDIADGLRGRLPGHPVLTPALPPVDGVAVKAQVLAPALPDHVVVVGHSLGGMVAQELALLPASPVTALVLCCTIPGVTDNVRSHNLQGAGLVDRAGSAALADVMAPALLGRDTTRPGRERALARVRQDMAATPPGVLAADLRAITEFDARGRVEALTLPALVVAGEGETNLGEQRALAAALDARFEVLRGTGHLGPAEDPDRFVELVGHFLDPPSEGAP